MADGGRDETSNHTRGDAGGRACEGTCARTQGDAGGLSSFALKMVAIVGMTANHAAYLFDAQLPFAARCLLYAAGGLTFPVMAFLLVEGYRHTSNVKKYALRLGVFAAVSQIPYALFLAGDANVLFTLLIGLGVLYAHDHVANRAAFWALFAAALFASLVCNWGFVGVVMIFLFKVLGAGTQRDAETGSGEADGGDFVPAALKTPLGAVAAPVLLVVVADGLPLLATLATGVSTAGDWSLLPFVLYPMVGCTLTIPLLRAYRGRRGLPMKWFFYAYYPLHIAVLGVAHLVLFGTMPTY